MPEDSKAQRFTAGWTRAIPAALISLIVLAFNFIGDGLRDAFDPTLHRQQPVPVAVGTSTSGPKRAILEISAGEEARS